MATPIHKINIFSDGSISTGGAIRYTGYRCRHISENGYVHELGKPAIRPGKDAPSVIFTQPMQERSFEINAGVLTPEKWRVVYGDETAFTNEQGFDPKDGTPRRDYINKRDLTAEYPKLMKGIIMAGSFYRARDDGTVLTMIPGIHAVDATKSIPPLSTILEKNWYFDAIISDYKTIFNFPQGGGSRVRIVYYLKEPVSYPKEWFTPWDADFLPDPLKTYL